MRHGFDFGTSVFSKEWRSIPYVSHNSETNAYLIERGVLDIYCPEDNEKRPVIIWFHGGGLRSGEKNLPQRLLKAYVLFHLIIAYTRRLNPRAILRMQLVL